MKTKEIGNIETSNLIWEYKCVCDFLFFITGNKPLDCMKAYLVCP